MDNAGLCSQASVSVRLEAGLLLRTQKTRSQKKDGRKRMARDSECDRTNDKRLEQPRWLVTWDVETSQLREEVKVMRKKVEPDALATPRIRLAQGPEMSSQMPCRVGEYRRKTDLEGR